jgi:hypothetical protein
MLRVCTGLLKIKEKKNNIYIYIYISVVVDVLNTLK